MQCARGVRKEIEMANRNNVPVFGVYVDKAKYLSKIPINLPRFRVVNWEWSKIAEKIDEMIKQGKNA